MRFILAVVLSVLLIASPALARVLDLSQAPYSMACDGSTDDSTGLQAAADEACTSTPTTLKLPRTAVSVCKLDTAVRFRCPSRLSIVGGDGTDDGGQVILRYTGTADTAFDLRGANFFRSAGVGWQATNAAFSTSAHTLVDLRLGHPCSNAAARMCLVDGDCPGGTCTVGTNQFAAEVLFERGGFYNPVTDAANAAKGVWLKHAIGVHFDTNVFRGGGYHAYGIEASNEWTSVVSFTRNRFYQAAQMSVFNLKWATTFTGNYWQPQGFDSTKAWAYDHGAGLLVEGFVMTGNSFWDVPVESATPGNWVKVAGSGLLIAGNKLETLGATPPNGVGIVLDETSQGVTITGNSFARLARGINLGATQLNHSDLMIAGNAYQSVKSPLYGVKPTRACSTKTAESLICD